MNFEKYIGIPYKDGGRDSTGLDCWGLVRLIYRDEMGIVLPSFDGQYSTDDQERLEELFHQYREGWEPCEAFEGAVVLFRVLGSETHVGVMVDSTHFIHIREGLDSVIEDVTHNKWKKRVVGFYKYSAGVVLNAVPHPLKTQRYMAQIAPGTTVKELIEQVSLQHNIQPELKSKIHVFVNGIPVTEQHWGVCTIKHGDVVEYRAVPGKDVIKMAVLVVVAFYAPQIAAQFLGQSAVFTATGALTLTGAIASAVVTVAGSFLINAIAPVRPPSVAESKDPGSPERMLLVEGGSNQYNPYGSIPVVLGKVRVTPLLGSVNYLTYESERNSYLSMLLVWGYGPLYLHPDTYRIGDLELNNTNFTNWEKVDDFRITELNLSQSAAFNRLYGKDVVQVNNQIELTCDGNPETSVSPGPPAYATTNEEYDPITNKPSPVLSATVAIHFPQGLRRIVIKGDGAGNSEATSVAFRVDVSTNIDNLGDEGSWSLLDSFSLGGDSPKRDAFTWTKTYSLNTNKVALRIRRETGDNTEDNDNYRYYFTSVLQNVTFTRNIRPVLDPVGSKIAKTAFKIKATNQLNGTIQGISAVVQTWCKVWNGTAWVNGASSNPAALMRYVLEHPANPRRIIDPDTQINLPSLQYFFNYCQARGFEYNGIMAQARSVLEVIRDICAAGRASPALIDGKWSVVIDEAKPNVVQHFTPHNSWGFEGSKSIPKRPDGLRVTYYDEDRNYQESEIIVYDIGKTATNASLFESISLPGVTKKSLVVDHCRWHMAQIKLRPEVYTLNCDIEYLVCNRGDRVKVSHDVPMWGLGSGRVKNRLSDIGLELDEELPLKANSNYTIRFRTKTGGSVTRTVVPKTLDGYYNTINLTSPVTVDECDVGDLFLFGELDQESQDLIVLSIEPATNNTALLTLVDYGVAPGYNIFNDYSNLTANIVFDSQITLPPTLQLSNFGTKVPQITGFVSDESVMERVSKGVYKYKINVAYVNASNLPASTQMVEFEYKLSSDLENLNSKNVMVSFMNGSANITDVTEGELYYIRARYVGKDGTTGKWSPYSPHTVVGKTSKPSQVSEFDIAVDRASGQLLISWKNNPEPDVYTYEVRTSNTDWGTDGNTRVFFGDATKTLTKFPGVVTNYYIKAVDSSGNYSETSTVKTYEPATVPNITSLTHSYADTSLTNATVLLEWTGVTTSEFAVDYYEILYGTVKKETKSTSITLPADWVGERTFTVKTVDIHGQKSVGFVSSIPKSPPNPPLDLKTQVIDNTVMLYWTLPPRTSLPIDHVLIKRGSSWNGIDTVVIGEKKGEFTSISEVRGGDYTYWLACVDTERVESEPQAINTTVAEPPDFVFNDQVTSTFTGTKVNCAIDGSGLVLPVNITETFENHFSTRSWLSPQAQVDAGYPIYAQPSVESGYYEEVFYFGPVPLQSSRITVNYIGTNIAGTPIVKNTISVSLDGTTYTDYPNVTQIFGTNFRYVKIKIEVTNNPTTSRTNLYSVRGLEVVLDAKLKDDVGVVVAYDTDALGTIVNFSKEFIDVQSITLAPKGTSAAYAVYDIKDSFITGTYSVVSGICTAAFVNHGFITGQKVKLFINSGTGLSGIYTITGYTPDTFTVAMATANTSGSISLYPQSFRVYLFNSSGNRVTPPSPLSWAVRGY